MIPWIEVFPFANIPMPEVSSPWDQCCDEDEHATAVLSGAPLPCPSTTAHALPPYPSLRTAPCTAASEQSPAAIDPCGDVGCLAGFRQEGSPPYMPCMRYTTNIKGDTKNWNSLTRYMIRADLDCVFGKS